MGYCPGLEGSRWAPPGSTPSRAGPRCWREWGFSRPGRASQRTPMRASHIAGKEGSPEPRRLTPSFWGRQSRFHRNPTLPTAQRPAPLWEPLSLPNFLWVFMPIFFLLHILLLLRDQLCSRFSAWYLQIKPIQDRLRGEKEGKLRFNLMPCLKSHVLRWLCAETQLCELMGHDSSQPKNYSTMAELFMECVEELEPWQKKLRGWEWGGGWARADLCCRGIKFKSSNCKYFEQGRPQLIFEGSR